MEILLRSYFKGYSAMQAYLGGHGAEEFRGGAGKVTNTEEGGCDKHCRQNKVHTCCLLARCQTKEAGALVGPRGGPGVGRRLRRLRGEPLRLPQGGGGPADRGDHSGRQVIRANLLINFNQNRC